MKWPAIHSPFLGLLSYAKPLFPRQSTLLRGFAEETLETPLPVLEGVGATGDLADTQMQLLRNLALGRALGEFPDELPPFGEGFEFLGGQKVFQ